MRKTDKYRYVLVLIGLVVLHFTVRGRLGDDRIAPDFLLLALLIYTVRAQPGRSAAAGFVIGLLRDALTPASFGAGALAHTVVGYLAAWGRAVFFPDNLLVNAGLFAAGVMLRNTLMLLASGTPAGQLSAGLLVWAPLQALTTAAAGVVILLLFRNWFAIRIEV